jgi:DNA helicase-2/ATP-dependent DNA helicase PcrA
VEEIKAVADSLAGYLPDHPNATVAVLTPRNQRGIELVDELERRKLPYEDGLLRSSSAVRSSVGVLSELLAYLADPQSAVKLANVFQVWMRKFKESGVSVKRAAELIRKAGYVEDYLWPGPDRDWLQELDTAGEAPAILTQLEHFRDLARRWQAAVLLPVDQLVLTIAHDFLTEPAELAIAHKLASLLDNASRTNPSWRLPEFTRELDLIVKNERRFLRFSQFDTAFEPTKFKGKVVISTIHKAKGLEWDRVYLLSANNYDFPSGIEGDYFLSEKWYLRNSLNLPAETLAQLAAVLSRQEYEWYEEGRATYESRLDYVRERLRLFYVGITRARKELVITWNTGRRGDQEPALPFAALKDNWERRSSGI